MSTSTPIFSCQFWNIWVKQFGQFHFHSYIWYEMNEGLIILYWRQHLNLINLIDFRDQLNVALKTDYKYFRTINLKKIFGWYLPHEGGLWEKCYFQIFCSTRAKGCPCPPNPQFFWTLGDQTHVQKFWSKFCMISKAFWQHKIDIKRLFKGRNVSNCG